MTLSRRKLLAMSAVGLLPRISNGADPSRMIVRSPKPEDLEMPLDGFTDWITPIDRFFVRCHTYTPTVNLSEWSLKIDGMVDQPIDADDGRSEEAAANGTGRRAGVRRQWPKLL